MSDCSAPLPFFVYGTLLPGQPNARLWQEMVAHQEPAIFHSGTLFDMGAFPMLIEQPDGVPIRGMLLEIVPEQYSRVLRALDCLEEYDPAAPEQSSYRRVERTVQTEAGELRRVWVYIGRFDLVRGCTPCGGDWAAWSALRRERVADWWQRFLQNPSLSLLDDGDSPWRTVRRPPD
jgi:gamma-glutamylcyclotransferase (GGCT)/AIG2-like uncharacterized protein YtfP